RNWNLSQAANANLSSFNYTSDMPYIRKLYADYNDDILTADFFKNSGDGRVSFDKEHIWAQSLGNFGRTGGAGSDFHMLFAADVKGNQQAHSNYNFATPTSGIVEIKNDKGGYVGRNGYISGSSQKVFEPLDQYKGDIARAMFYMPTRYNEFIDALHPRLTLVNESPSAVTASNIQDGLAGDLASLLEWNNLDPVDEYEIHRNNLIYNNYQGNRNPFIDHPEWANIVYDSAYTGSGANNNIDSACTIGNCENNNQILAGLDSITITKPADIKDYYIGANLDKTGLEVTANFDDATSVKILNYSTTISSESGLTFTSGGAKTVTLSFTSGNSTKTVSYVVQVANSATFAASTTTSIIALGETFDHASISATMSFSTSNGPFVRNINHDHLSFTGPDTSKIRNYQIAVNYGVYNDEVIIKVSNADAIVDFVPVATDLFISEYIEGSSNNKVIELYNGTGTAINLSNYSLKIFANGATAATNSLNLSTTLVNNATYVISNSNSSQTIIDKTNITHAVANFNGNDAVGLYKGAVLIDLIGEIGVDPGTKFVFDDYNNETSSTLDRTLVRHSSIQTPNPLFTGSEWLTYGQDEFSYLGTHSPSWGDLGVTSTEQALSYAKYFMFVTAPYCFAGTALDIPWSELKDEYVLMVAASKDIFFSASTKDIVDARQRYTLLVNRYPLFMNDNFIADGDDTLLVPSQKSPLTNSSNDNLLQVLFITLSLMSISGYYIVRKRRQTL
ncbi:MAG TPA: endonuclease, partial [Bacilli bacterium]|nr:endonuclease [Bacilli bacterium]